MSTQSNRSASLKAVTQPLAFSEQQPQLPQTQGLMSATHAIHLPLSLFLMDAVTGEPCAWC